MAKFLKVQPDSDGKGKKNVIKSYVKQTTQ